MDRVLDRAFERLEAQRNTTQLRTPSRMQLPDLPLPSASLRPRSPGNGDLILERPYNVPKEDPQSAFKPDMVGYFHPDLSPSHGKNDSYTMERKLFTETSMPS